MKTVLAAVALAFGFSSLWAQAPAATDPLPAKAGIYAMDPVAHTPPLRLRATEVRFNRHTGNNIARNSFYINSKTTLDLEGKTSETTLPDGKATFLVPADAASPELSLTRLTLVRLQSESDRRILAALKANAFGGSPARRLDVIAIGKQTIGDGDWVRVTPTADLTPGEYAIAYFPSDPRMFPDAVYDFHIGGDK
jgi:hypothetical protein